MDTKGGGRIFPHNREEIPEHWINKPQPHLDNTSHLDNTLVVGTIVVVPTGIGAAICSVPAVGVAISSVPAVSIFVGGVIGFNLATLALCSLVLAPDYVIDNIGDTIVSTSTWIGNMNPCSACRRPRIEDQTTEISI